VRLIIGHEEGKWYMLRDVEVLGDPHILFAAKFRVDIGFRRRNEIGFKANTIRLRTSAARHTRQHQQVLRQVSFAGGTRIRRYDTIR